MTMDRRSAIRILAGSGAATVAAAAGGGGLAAAETTPAPEDAVGMLYDATRCIGCKACVVACREANDLPAEQGPWSEKIYDAPLDLSGQTKNIIKLYKEGPVHSYMKAQCMHCVDPACAAACMLGALHKGKGGIVSWDGNRCVGCRYCQMACPFNIPKFEWHALNPRIVKCEMCRHLLAKGGIPACVKVCPRQAVIFGRRGDLLEEARRRIAENPGAYVPKVYGEHDGGGTQVLYLSQVPFEKLGLPDLGPTPVCDPARRVQHTIYRGLVAPVALYALLGTVMIRNRRRAAVERPAPGEEDGP